jgi:hypothetical protein
MAKNRKSESTDESSDESRPKGYASETTVSPLQSVGTFPSGKGNAPSAAELADRTRANVEARREQNPA